MPELPEVETIRRGLLCLENKTLIKIHGRRKDLRWPITPALFTLRHVKIQKITRRGKYLLFSTAKGVILIHLGMSGRLFFAKDLPIEKHDHVDFIFKDHLIRFRDPRRFGVILLINNPHTHPLLRTLGPEPLDEFFSIEYLKQALQKSKKPLKLWLMDAKNIVGIGNIYANEILYLSKLHPERQPLSLSLKEIKLLYRHIKAVLAKAITLGGSTLKDFVNSQGEAGYFQQTLHVYGRAGQPCTNCTAKLIEIKLSGRSTVFCQKCQR